MPRVEQAQQQVSTRITPGAQITATPQFGIGDAVNTLKPVVDAAVEVKTRLDTTTAEEALVQFERDKNDLFFNPDSGYFNTQGKNAYDAAAGTSESLTQLKERYRDTLTSSNAKLMFNRAADAHITRSNSDIMRHSAKGLQAYEVATMQAQTENTLENAALYWNDPQRLRVQMVLGEQSIIDASERQGLGAEATAEKLQTYRSVFSSNTVEAATTSSAEEGQEALDKAIKNKLVEGPELNRLNNLIASKAKTEQTALVAQQSVVLASKFNREQETRQGIIDEVNTIEDPALRKSTMTQAIYQYNQNKIAKSEEQESNYNTGVDFVTEGGSVTQLQATQPEVWEGMSAKQRNNLAAGKHIVTDQLQLNEVLSLPNSKLKDVNPADYVGVFRPNDVSEVRSAVERARKGISNTSVQTPSLKVRTLTTQFFGQPTTWNNKSKKPKVQAFMQAIQSSIETAEDAKGGRLAPTELDTLLNDFSKEIVIERPWYMFDDDIDVTNTPPQQVAQLNRFIRENGDDSYQLIVKQLNELGVEITVENILTAYNQATQQ